MLMVLLALRMWLRCVAFYSWTSSTSPCLDFGLLFGRESLCRQSKHTPEFLPHPTRSWWWVPRGAGSLSAFESQVPLLLACGRAERKLQVPYMEADLKRRRGKGWGKYTLRSFSQSFREERMQRGKRMEASFQMLLRWNSFLMKHRNMLFEITVN